MAGTKITNRQTRIKMLNKAIKILIKKRGQDVEIKQLAKLCNVSGPTMNAALKTLREMGRIDIHRNVVNSFEILEKEYAQYGYPYGKKKRTVKRPAGKGTVPRKVVRKAVKRVKRSNGVLKEAIEVPVMEHPSGATITINLNVEELVRACLKLIREGGVR